MIVLFHIGSFHINVFIAADVYNNDNNNNNNNTNNSHNGHNSHISPGAFEGDVSFWYQSMSATWTKVKSSKESGDLVKFSV